MVHVALLYFTFLYIFLIINFVLFFHGEGKMGGLSYKLVLLMYYYIH